MGRIGIFLFRACTLLALTAGSGCGGPGKPIKTEGLITLHGNPVAAATVTFHPEGGQGRLATGMTGDDGVFQLQTFAPDDGALPGDYKVTVIKTEGVAPPPAGNDPAKHKEWMMKTMFKKPTQKAPASRLPKEYADASKTPLRVHVPHGGQVKLELKEAGGT
jgi:hypothetical protein